jgi:hypothetical protein
MRPLTAIAALLTLLGLSPLLGLAAGLIVSGLNGCAINEGTTTSCIVFGAEWGPMLTQLTVAGWYLLLTWPLAAAGLTMLVVVMVQRLKRRSPD